MCNSIAMELRKVAIVRSFPAALHGYRRVFVTNAGWADLREDPRSTVYSVCHEMTIEAKLRLDSTEGDNDIREVALTLVNAPGKRVIGQTYINIVRDLKLSKPTARYLDIMCQGIAAVNMPLDIVEALQQTPCIPRKTRDEFKSWHGLSWKPFTLEELNGLEDHMIFNGKVLHFDKKNKRAMQLSTAVLGPQMYHAFNFSGKDMTLFWARQYYEPLFAPAFSVDAITAEHFAWLEDWLSSATLCGFVCVGYVEGSAADPAADSATQRVRCRI
jgi:hypothetical protein